MCYQLIVLVIQVADICKLTNQKSGGTVKIQVTTMTSPVLTFNPHPSRPALRLPAGACDSHVHVFGPAARFAFAATRNFTPIDAPKETLFALH